MGGNWGKKKKGTHRENEISSFFCFFLRKCIPILGCEDVRTVGWLDGLMGRDKRG